MSTEADSVEGCSGSKGPTVPGSRGIVHEKGCQSTRGGGGQPASQPFPPETAMAPHGWAADNAKVLQKPQGRASEAPHRVLHGPGVGQREAKAVGPRVREINDSTGLTGALPTQARTAGY